MSGSNSLHGCASSTVVDGAAAPSGEQGKLTLQPREVKFSAVAPHSEVRFCETTVGRRGFRPPTKLHALAIHPTKYNFPFDLDGAGHEETGLKTLGDDEGTKPSLTAIGLGSGPSSCTISPVPNANSRGALERSLFDPGAPAVVNARAGTAIAKRRGNPAFTVQHTSSNTSGAPSVEGRAGARRRKTDANAIEPWRGAGKATVSVTKGSRGSDKNNASRSLAPLFSTPASLDRCNQLWIAGSSFLTPEPHSQAASSALAKLSECVTTERRLREQLEEARTAKLRAFRTVIEVFLSSWRSTPGGNSSSTHAVSTVKQLPDSRVFPDTIALAKCSVIASTLVTTIQSYVRAKQARQLVQALDHLGRACGVSPQAHVDYNLTLSLRSDGETRPVLSRDAQEGRSSASGFLDDSTTETALEEILDLEEVNRLRQLYFDYFDCEAVQLPSLGESNAIENGFAPQQGCSPKSEVMRSTNPSSMFSATLSSSTNMEEPPRADASLLSQRKSM